MSDQIREQVSAFLDGELPGSETELLLKRLMRDADLRESFGRYALIGEAVRGSRHVHLTRGFAARVNGAIDGEPAAPAAAPAAGRAPRWWRPAAGLAVAAGVAAVAVFALQQRTTETAGAARAFVAANPARGAPAAAAPALAPMPVVARNHEALSYTVPAAFGTAPAAMPAARLTNYVFAHSQYSSLLGQRDVLTDLIVDGNEQAPEPDASIAR